MPMLKRKQIERWVGEISTWTYDKCSILSLKNEIDQSYKKWPNALLKVNGSYEESYGFDIFILEEESDEAYEKRKVKYLASLKKAAEKKRVQAEEKKNQADIAKKLLLQNELTEYLRLKRKFDGKV